MERKVQCFMNRDHLQQIFTNYINKFEGFNNDDGKKPSEYYKWEIVSWFKGTMDEALEGKPEEFSQQLKQIKKNTHDFIDNASGWPLDGLRKIAEQDGEKVQKMFRDLYAEDYRNLDKRQEKIEAFLEESHRLRKKHNLADQYKNTFNSVTAYLFLYDPENNYVYKPNAAKKFAKYVDFGDDFGLGDHIKLKNYYRMCDELADEIKRNSQLTELDDLRTKLLNKGLDAQAELYNDGARHVLAYDIIYCAYAYNLFNGITLTHYTMQEQKEQKLLEEKQQRAKELFETLKVAQEKQSTLDAAMNEMEKWFCEGKAVTYKGFGKSAQAESGIIIKNGKGLITVKFSDGAEKCLGLFDAVINAYVRPEAVECERFADVMGILKNKSSIEGALVNAEREFVPYREYL